MRTLDDLRRSFEQHADLAGPSQGLVRAARESAARIRRRRRIVRAGVSAVVVAGLALTIPVVVSRGLAEGPAPAPPATAAPPAKAARQPGQVTVDLDPASGYRIESVQVGTSRQALITTPARPATPPDTDPKVHVAVFDPGGFNSGSLPGTETLTVAGHDAWFQPAFPLGTLQGVPADDARGPAVGWQDRSGAWVVVYRRPETVVQKTEILRVAEGLRIGPPRDVTVPVRLGWLPAGMRLTEITVRRHGVDTILTLRRGQDEVRLWVGSDRLVPSGGYNGAENTQLTVAGRPAVLREDAKTRSLIVPRFGTCRVLIETTNRKPVIKADFVRLLETLTVADCNDQTSWTRPGP